MRVILLGATGMIGHGVLQACLRDDEVTEVLVVGRRTSGAAHSKLRELLLRAPLEPPFDWSAAAHELRGFDACFFCLGVSAAGLSEEEYMRTTYDLTLAAATTLVKHNPSMTFIYVSGQGTDASERGRAMWARVKGRTENALQRLPFRAAYMFRPGAIIPKDGARSATRWYRVLYRGLTPVLPLFQRLFPEQIVTTTEIGLAMIRVAKYGHQSPVLEAADIARRARENDASAGVARE